VLRPIVLAMTSTTAEAVAPTPAALKDPFRLALQSAEEEANETLDQILSEGTRPLIVKVDLSLRNREITTEVEVNTLVEEIRRRLLEQVHAGARVRLLRGRLGVDDARGQAPALRHGSVPAHAGGGDGRLGEPGLPVTGEPGQPGARQPASRPRIRRSRSNRTGRCPFGRSPHP
jgi:hypothetical protein